MTLSGTPWPLSFASSDAGRRYTARASRIRSMMSSAGTPAALSRTISSIVGGGGSGGPGVAQLDTRPTARRQIKTRYGRMTETVGTNAAILAPGITRRSNAPPADYDGGIAV